MLIQNITAINVLSTAEYIATELISGIATVQNEADLIHVLNASFTEDHRRQ